MKRIIFITVAILFYFVVQAKDSSIKNIMNQTNNIEIRFFKGKKDRVYRSKRRIDLLYLKDLITKAKNKSDLLLRDTTGEIIYYKNKVQLFKAYFCTRESGSKYDTEGTIIFEDGINKTKAVLNYGSFMLINEEYYQLQKAK